MLDLLGYLISNSWEEDLLRADIIDPTPIQGLLKSRSSVFSAQSMNRLSNFERPDLLAWDILRYFTLRQSIVNGCR